MIVRTHTNETTEQLAELWNATLRFDPVDERTLLRKVYLDPNFRSEGLFFAVEGEELVGFCLALTRHVPIEHAPLEDLSGYITAFGVRERSVGAGAGKALFQAAEDHLRSCGKTSVRIAPYIPNYFVPGVDEKAYPRAGEFLVRRGYERVDVGLGMDACLIERDPLVLAKETEAAAEAAGITVQPLTSGLVPEFFRFLRADAPPDWSRHARQILMEGSPLSDVVVAVKGERIVGYCQFEGSHFGPFGVSEEARGGGVGTALLARSLETMKRRGEHCAWVVWTGERAARLYERLGFRRTRDFTLFRKTLA